VSALVQAAQYSATNARVRALLTQLIPPAQWADLIEAPDLPGLVSQLRDTAYDAQLPALAEEETDLIAVERAVVRRQTGAERLPLAFLHGKPLDLLEWFWRRFELENLKTVLRAVHHQTPPSQALPALIPLGAASALDWSSLAASPSVAAVVERLSSTWYGQALQHALDQYRRQQSVFPLEIALDLGYYSGLLERIEALGGDDRSDAQTFLGAWVDAQNLLWAYRYRLYAGLSPEEILNYTLHRRLRVNADVVRAIALGAPVEDVVQEVWRGRLAGLGTLQGLSEPEMLPQLELLIHRHLYDMAERARAAYPLRLASVLSYVFLLDCEARDLVALAEGKSFGWSGAQIRAYLVGQRGV